MAPEYSKAAKGLHPLIPLYAVDCDAQENKALCAEQGVQGFPTVKLFPRGNQVPPITHNGERTANAIFHWASRNVPHGIKKLKAIDEIAKWAKQTDKPRVLLLNKKEKTPLLWQVLSNKFKHRMNFGAHHDSNGISSVELGFEKGGEKDSKILIYPVGSGEPVLYDGVMKSDALSKFFKSVIKGTIDLNPKKHAQMVVDDQPAAKRSSVTEDTPVGEPDPRGPQPEEPEVIIEKAVPETEPAEIVEEVVAQPEETKERIADEL